MRVGQARRRDATEPPIVQAIRRVGGKVRRLSEPGVSDLLVLFRGRLFLLETKTRLGKPTAAQERFTQEGWPSTMVRTEFEALKAIGAI